MSSYVTESSVASVTTDLVREESLGLKIFLSGSYIAYILSSFAVTFAFCLDFYRNLSEFVASLVLLVVSWIAVSAANLILYRTIRPRGRRALTENEPGTEITAGYCVRLLFTVLPFSPVLRYAEAYRADKVLARLEAKAASDSVSVTAASLHSASRLASANDAALRAAHRASRECRRRDKAAGLLALFSAVIGAGPMAILQLFFFAQRNFLNVAKFVYGEVFFLFISVIFSIIWLSAALAHFFPARRHLLYAEERPGARGSPTAGFSLLLLFRLTMTTLRVLSMAFFAAQFGAYFLLPVVLVHCALCFVALLVTRRAEDGAACGGGYAVPRDLFFAYASFFDFVNAELGHTRLRYLLFYTLTYAENAALMGLWYSKWQPEEGLLRLPLFLAVLIVSLLGWLLLQFYYFCFFPEYHNPGLLNLCFPESAAEAEAEMEMAKSVSAENVLLRSRPNSLHGSSEWDAPGGKQPRPPSSHATSAAAGPNSGVADPRMSALLRIQAEEKKTPAASVASGGQRPPSMTSARSQPRPQQYAQAARHSRPSSQHQPQARPPSQPYPQHPNSQTPSMTSARSQPLPQHYPHHPNSQAPPQPRPPSQHHPNSQPHPRPPSQHHPNSQAPPQPRPPSQHHPHSQQHPRPTSQHQPNSQQQPPPSQHQPQPPQDPRMAPPSRPSPPRVIPERSSAPRRSEPPPQRARSNSGSDISTCSASSASER